MKKLFVIHLIFLFVTVNLAFAAEVFLDPGESMTIGDTQVHCQSSNGGPIEVTSSVDLECIKALYDDHYGFPTWGDVITWAYQNCRTAPLRQDQCITVSSTNNPICYSDLIRNHSGVGFPTNDELIAIQDACKDVLYKCEFYNYIMPQY